MATVTFRRTADVNSIPIIDGSLVFDLAHNKIYMDNGDTRIQYGGDTDLITNPSIASTVNAFSAVGSLDLFLQKTNVINTKAEALNITQNNVPLGCLAFKEMLGTTDYSGVGNGTVSGAITNLNGRTNTAQTGVNNLVSQLKTGSTSFYFDSKNGKWGWNSDPARGAGTFHPFSVDTLPDGEFYACAVCAEPSDGRVSIPVHIFQKYHYFRIHVEGANKSLAYYADNGNAFEVPSTPRNLDTWYSMNTSNYLNVKWFGGGNGYAIFYVILGL